MTLIATEYFEPELLKAQQTRQVWQDLVAALPQDGERPDDMPREDLSRMLDEVEKAHRSYTDACIRLAWMVEHTTLNAKAKP